MKTEILKCYLSRNFHVRYLFTICKSRASSDLGVVVHGFFKRKSWMMIWHSDSAELPLMPIRAQLPNRIHQLESADAKKRRSPEHSLVQDSQSLKLDKGLILSVSCLKPDQ